jgi:hypothetical protein
MLNGLSSPSDGECAAEMAKKLRLASQESLEEPYSDNNTLS